MPSMINLSRNGILLSVSLLILSGCATVPRESFECPEIPPLTAREPLGPSYQERMQAFLSGKLPAQTDTGQPLPLVMPMPTRSRAVTGE